MEFLLKNEITSGIQEIDSQHHHILELLNRLVSTNKQSKNSEKLLSLLTEFSQAVKSHFDYEEKLLEKYRYKGLKHHKYGHEEVLDLLNSLTMSALLDGKEISEDSINKLVRWFEEHLASEDTKYFESVKKSQENNN